jgi:3-oxoacyl-[acyl-carrier protein] reductase
VESRFALSGQRILITGASGGIGRATALACARMGADLVLIDLREDAALSAQCRALGRSVQGYACDVSERRSVEATLSEVGPVDAAVLNAGINTWSSWTAQAFEDDFHRTLDVNVGGILNFARVLLPEMKRRGSGRLVLTGSVVAWTGGTMDTVPIQYVAAKGAVHSCVRWLMRRGAPEVLVNAVAPGPVRSDMTSDQTWSPPPSMPIPRLAEPDEVAWPIAFLCSPAAGFINGVVLDINGGNHLR